jgi:hypothetical protein
MFDVQYFYCSGQTKFHMSAAAGLKPDPAENLEQI